jgi:PKD repeat protein
MFCDGSPDKLKTVCLKKYSFIAVLAFCWSFVFAQDPHPNPTANFEVSNLCYGSITSFSNTSTSILPPTFEWTIWQEGNAVPIYTSTATSINFQFPAKTTYTVLLTVIYYVTATHSHSDDTYRTIYIDSVPVANFDMKECHGRFTDLSSCCTSYTWNFGDGTTSNLKSPVHTYPNANTYTVTLIAGNGTQTDTMVKEVTPYANLITGNFNVTHDQDTVRFQSLDDSLKAAFVDWEWDFGDGNDLDVYGVAGWKVSHHYERFERDTFYVVSLREADQCFFVENEKTVFIKGLGKDVKGTSVFPNPVENGYLNIESAKKDQLTEIRVIDFLGKKLENVSILDKPYGYYVLLNDLAEGLYIVQVVFTDEVKNYRILNAKRN